MKFMKFASDDECVRERFRGIQADHPVERPIPLALNLFCKLHASRTILNGRKQARLTSRRMISRARDDLESFGRFSIGSVHRIPLIDILGRVIECFLDSQSVEINCERVPTLTILFQGGFDGEISPCLDLRF